MPGAGKPKRRLKRRGPGCRPDRRRPARDRVDFGRDRVQQPRDQGRCALLQDPGQAPDHGEDRAQGGAGPDARTRAPGLRGELPGRPGGRHARPRGAEGGDPPRHHPGQRHVRQQRDRRRPGHPGHRGAVPREGNHLPRRRGAGDGQGRDRRQEAAGRPDEPGLAQDLRPQGIGALYVCRKPRVRIEAQMHGGGHERGMRSGTLPTHQIVGMGEAFRWPRPRWRRTTPRRAACRSACSTA